MGFYFIFFDHGALLSYWMDQLLKEFELLSLPSRVNLETISDDCVDK